MTVVATAGHVDHGKSTLVRALTGTDPDRLAEEKERGLTIDLGFANLDLPSGGELSFIDVPGHIRFLRNMLAGVGAVDGCVFVVSATEGWKPQSEEHLRILDLLGIRHGVVALTMVDLVDDDLRELAELDVAEHVEGTFLDGAPVLPVSATEGLGLPALVEALDELVERMGPPLDRGRPRLWVDRSFAPSGAGTVVTGTLTGGGLSSGDLLVALPGGHEVRVRSLQSHHRTTERVGAGNRVAANLSGVSHHELGRGTVVTEPGGWHHTRMVDAELRVLDQLDHDVSRRGAYAVYLGSGEFPARVRVLGTDTLAPGTVGHVRIHLSTPLPLLPGDRFILRESGRDETVGGGEILDIEPQLPAARARPDRSIDRLVAERGWVETDHLRRLTGADVEPTVGRWTTTADAVEAVRADVLERIGAAGDLGLDVAALDERERAVADLAEEIRIERGRATIGEPVDPLTDHPYLAELDADPFAPPDPGDHDRGEVRELVRRGFVVEQDGVFFSTAAVERAARVIAGHLATNDGFTVADARDLLGTSRKYVLPLLNHFDRNGITRRRDDLRIAGPRLPEP